MDILRAVQSRAGDILVRHNRFTTKRAGYLGVTKSLLFLRGLHRVKDMSGETNLATLLQNMQPSLDQRQFVFCCIDALRYEQLKVTPIGIFREAEGITIILDKHYADRESLPYSNIWALITLTVHSSLTAVGFLAAITNKLAAAGISVNPVAAYYHDHLFVPWTDRERAIDLLSEFSG